MCPGGAATQVAAGPRREEGSRGSRRRPQVRQSQTETAVRSSSRCINLMIGGIEVIQITDHACS